MRSSILVVEIVMQHDAASGSPWPLWDILPMYPTFNLGVASKDHRVQLLPSSPG
jgi:hypothetical protein